MADPNLQDRLARLKQKLRADDEAVRLRGCDLPCEVDTCSALRENAVVFVIVAVGKASFSAQRGLLDAHCMARAQE